MPAAVPVPRCTTCWRIAVTVSATEASIAFSSW
jgi:hypothetical protein